MSIVFASILYVSTRNLAKYDYGSRNYIPVKFPIWEIVLIILLLLIPYLNIVVFLVCIIGIFAKISIGTKGIYNGWHLIKGKKNWVYSVIRFSQKEI